jgi:hypothetical protein
MRIRPKTQRKLLKAMQGKALFMVTKATKRQIGVVGNRIMMEMASPGNQADVRNAFSRRLREHFDRLRQQGVRFRDLGERMAQDLMEMQQLIEATNPDRRALLKNLERKPLEAVIGEMRNYYQQMQQAQRKAA